MSNFQDWIGKHVSWEKIGGRPNPNLPFKTGFGSIQTLEVGQRLLISGDNGIVTTRVESLEKDGNKLVVTTQNSVYLVDKW